MDDDIDFEEVEFFTLTEGQIAEYLASVGAAVLENCPKCSSDKWNEGSDPSQVLLMMPESKARTYSSNIKIECGRCGFVEYYSSRPVINHYMSKKDEG